MCFGIDHLAVQNPQSIASPSAVSVGKFNEEMTKTRDSLLQKSKQHKVTLFFDVLRSDNKPLVKSCLSMNQ